MEGSVAITIPTRQTSNLPIVFLALGGVLVAMVIVILITHEPRPTEKLAESTSTSRATVTGPANKEVSPGSRTELRTTETSISGDQSAGGSDASDGTTATAAPKNASRGERSPRATWPPPGVGTNTPPAPGMLDAKLDARPQPAPPTNMMATNSPVPYKSVTQLRPAVAVPILAELPKYVNLPVLNRLTVGHDETLFHLRPPLGIECKLSVANPERKPGDRTRFELRPLDDGSDGQSWQVDLVTSVNSKSELYSNIKETRAPIARLMWGDAFQFRWLKGAEQLPGDGLRSCGLEMEANGQQHFISLRSPQKIEPLVVDLDQAFNPQPIVGLGLPGTDLWELELIRVEGSSMPEGGTVTGPQTVKGMRGSIRVPIGASELDAEIVLKLGEPRGQIVVRMTVQYQDIDSKATPLTNERIATLKRTLPREFQEAQTKLDGVQSRQVAYATELQQARDVLSGDAMNEQANITAIHCEAQLEHLAGQEKTLLKRLPRMQKRISWFNALAEACRLVHKNVRLHVRVACLTGTHQLEFLTTE